MKLILVAAGFNIPYLTKATSPFRMTDLSYEKGNVQSLSTAPTPPPLYSIPSKPRSCCFYYLFFFSTFLSVLILCFTLILFPVLFQMIVNTQVKIQISLLQGLAKNFIKIKLYSSGVISVFA